MKLIVEETIRVAARLKLSFAALEPY